MNDKPINPYESPASVATADTTAQDRHPFLLGFRNGAIWSLLVLAIAVPTFFQELSIPYRSKYDPASDTLTQVTMPISDKVYLWSYALGIGLSGITLPWAISAGIAKWISSPRVARTVGRV